MSEDKIRKSLTRKQVAFLAEYRESFSMRKAVAAGGYSSQTVSNMLRKDSLFTRTFKELQKNLEQDPRLTKLSGLEKLLRYQSSAEEDGDYKLALEIQKEINKMVQGNIAPTKSIDERNNKLEVTLIDFTKKLEDNKSNIISIDNYQEAEEV